MNMNQSVFSNLRHVGYAFDDLKEKHTDLTGRVESIERMINTSKNWIIGTCIAIIMSLSSIVVWLVWHYVLKQPAIS